MLEDIDELRTRTGRITVGILIAQDLAVVPMILLVDVAAIGEFDVLAVGRILLSVGLLLALILFLGRRQRQYDFRQVGWLACQGRLSVIPSRTLG